MTRTEAAALVKEGMPFHKIVQHFANVTRRPLTGSIANDVKFYRSLSTEDKKTFDEAKKERMQIYSIVRQARP